ncbi:hypothetical protein QBC43DRAFT_302745 [Cladorrhinum sp. PSN259]|nr:hypothetical protein QBC43DRAFT_302745 [Cladorrhinum sp. PSN259]
MKFTAIIAGAAALISGFATASPIEARDNDLAARATHVDITGFSVTCGSSSCTYLATGTLKPENIVINFNATTTGSTIPSGFFYTSSNPNAVLRLTHATTIYRLVFTWIITGGNSVDFSFVFPAGSFPGNAAYTGPSIFTAS